MSKLFKKISRASTASVLLFGLAGGCPQPPPRSALDADRPFVRCEELQYHIEYEIDPATSHMHHANKNWIDPSEERDGKNGSHEYVGVVVRGHYVLRIVDGAVTLNNRLRCTIQKGDRLKVSRDLRIWVNGSEIHE